MTIAHSPTEGSVWHDEIRWTSAPDPRIEDADLLDLYGLDLDGLRAYAFAMRGDLQAVRTMLHVATAELATQVAQSQRMQARMRQLIAELRDRQPARRSAA